MKASSAAARKPGRSSWIEWDEEAEELRAANPRRILSGNIGL